LSANRGNIAAVRRHRVLASAIYELPIGNGKRFFNHMSSVPQALLGGWSMSTVSMWQTGPYLTAMTSPSYDPGNLNLVYRGAFQRPDCIGDGNLANPNPGEYFNINAFNPIPTGPVGTCRVGSLLGPGTVAIAAGLAKTFSFGERVRMRFESTFTNLPNHLNYWTVLSEPFEIFMTNRAFSISWNIEMHLKAGGSEFPRVLCDGAQ
jgi:hypothetical protein